MPATTNNSPRIQLLATYLPARGPTAFIHRPGDEPDRRPSRHAGDLGVWTNGRFECDSNHVGQRGATPVTMNVWSNQFGYFVPLDCGARTRWR